jgi:DNA repair protein RadC
LVLAKSNKLTHKILISKGGQAGTIVDSKIVFKAALENNAANIILTHNHPSGNLRPSHEDISLTKKLVAAGKLMDIGVLDHVIITDDAFFSMADEGLM